VVAILVRSRGWKWLAASLAIGVVAQAALLTGDTLATRLNLPGLANGDLYHRTLGWRALGERPARSRGKPVRAPSWATRATTSPRSATTGAISPNRCCRGRTRPSPITSSI